MSIEDISSTDPTPRDVIALTPARREGKGVVPSIKHMEHGIFESTASITRDILYALAKDFQQLTQECSEFKDISFDDPTPGNVATLTRAQREGKEVIPSITRQFKYIMSSKSYVQDLHKEVGKLTYEIESVHNATEEARINLQNVYDHVTVWQASAEKALKEAGDLLGDFEKATKTCYHGTLPDPYRRYQLSRNTKDKIKDIQRLVRECIEFKDISSNLALRNIVQPMNLRDDGVFESRALIIREIMDALANNRNSVVGVYGMGGVGKSTLLVDAEKRIRKEKLFNLVAKANVSENPDIKGIQGEIAHALDLDIKDVEYVNLRAERLSTRLEEEKRAKKKVLIILDNLWKGLDLKSVGIPCGHDNKVRGCKLLLTSRFQDVLQREMGCDKPFHLDGLMEEEAKSLFERTVGDKVHHDPFKSLVDEALRKCVGLPFLIIMMAKFFKHANFSQWEDALKQIEMSSNKGISEKINKMLQLSYEYFEGEEGKEVKSFLRLCVVYGVRKPSLENLVRYGIGLRLFGEDSSMKEARNRLSSLIQTLQASSLLLDDEDADGFKIHPFVHGFVASVASKDDPLLVLKDNDKLVTEFPKAELKSCTAVCFPFVDMKELPEELDCPEMRIFLLFTNNKSLKIRDSYFNFMRKLKVLHLSQVHLTCSPSPFQFLENLQTLSLDDCSVDDVAMIGKLKGLQILSFAKSKIQRLPKEIGQLVELRLLDLNHCSRLKIIEPGVLGSLMKLEELYMENSFDQWNAVEQTPPTNAKLIELNNMKNLCTLYVCIFDPTVLPEDLNVKKLNKYGIQIGGRCWSSRKGSRTLELKLNPTRDIPQKGCIRTALDKTDSLYLDNLNGIEQSICELFPKSFPNLKHLHIENSSFMHIIFQQVVFPSLETLNITSMHNFQMIWDNQVYFQHLETLDVSHCHQLTYMFTLTIARNLVALRKLRISNCKMLIEVFSDDEGKEGRAVAFNQLKSMELDGLTGLRCFSSGGYTLMFPLLEDVIVTRCLNMKVFSKGPIEAPKLEKVQVSIKAWIWKGNLNITIQKMYDEMATVGVEFIRLSKYPKLIGKWHDERIPIEPFLKLESLEVDKCPSFITAIPYILMLALRNMRILQVRDCKSLEEIFDLKGLEGMESTQVLPQLWRLAMVNLPKLRRLWNKDIQGRLHFNFLSHLIVYKCNNLRHTFAPSMVQCLATLKYIELKECDQMEGVIAQEEKHESIVKKITFPYLCWMELEYLPNFTSFLLGKNHMLECPHLKWLAIAHCPRMRSFSGQSLMEIDHGIPSLFTPQVAFPSLETLHIVGLNNIEMTWDNQVATNSFPYLKSLYIQECNKLRCIWDKELHRQVIFQCLRSIRVFKCYSLTSLCPASIAKDLTQLEELEIDGCGIVELIEMEEGLVPTFVFPKLTFLRLEDLTELKCIYTRTHPLHWRALKTLEVHGCNKVEILASQPKNETPLHKQPLFLMEKGGFPSLEILHIIHMDNIEIIWDNFQHLKVLDMSHCNGLSYMFTPTMAEYLIELAELRISNCKMLAEVIRDERGKKGHEGTSDEWKNMELDWLTRLKCFTQKEGQGSTMKTIRFPNLLRVELECLPNLNSFLSGNNHTLEWPILEELTIANCPKMTRIGTLFPRPPSFISHLCTDIQNI